MQRIKGIQTNIFFHKKNLKHKFILTISIINEKVNIVFNKLIYYNTHFNN